MIDWVTAIVPCSNLNMDKLNDGYICKINRDGDTEWSKEISRSVPGSYDSSLRIGSHPLSSGPHIRLDGNPAKWLQGHNLFGSNNLIGLINAVMNQLTVILDFNPSEEDKYCWESGFFHLNRVDCAEMWDFPSMEDVKAWLNVAQFQSKSRHGRPLMTGGTLYFGKNSRRYSQKFYCKGEEIRVRGHQISDEIPKYEKLINFAQNKLRYELVLRAPKLKDLDLNYAGAWKIDTPQSLLKSFLNKLDLADQFRLTGDKFKFLKPRHQMALKAWENGVNLKEILPKNTFYRYRRELLKYEIDISVSKRYPEKNIISVRKILEKNFVPIPKWAYQNGLIYEPLYELVTSNN